MLLGAVPGGWFLFFSRWFHLTWEFVIFAFWHGRKFLQWF